MTDQEGERALLLGRIRARREELARFLRRAEPRASRLLITSIVAGALSAALTAGPGVGGEGFVEAARGLVAFGVPVWQVLCLIATGLSVTVVVTNGLLKAGDLGARIADGRVCAARLEGIETLLELGQTELAEAARDYTECLSRMPRT